mmetsp:Transcript_57719/g.115951  ORF Transcript_57719/g.115951 Transcript_57719/m.115951 type:complete len:287 (-) Transcript_57719:901-1761(-)
MSSTCPLMSKDPNCFPYVARPASVFIRVVFPAPEGPMMAVTRPGRHLPVTPLRTLKLLLRSTSPKRTNCSSIIVSLLSRKECSFSSSDRARFRDSGGRPPPPPLLPNEDDDVERTNSGRPPPPPLPSEEFEDEMEKAGEGGERGEGDSRPEVDDDDKGDKKEWRSSCWRRRSPLLPSPMREAAAARVSTSTSSFSLPSSLPPAATPSSSTSNPSPSSSSLKPSEGSDESGPTPASKWAPLLVPALAAAALAARLFLRKWFRTLLNARSVPMSTRMMSTQIKYTSSE